LFPTVNEPPVTEQVSVASAPAPVPPLVAHRLALENEPPFTETNQDHAYGAVPVEGMVPVAVSAWSTSSEVALTEGAAGGVSEVATVTVEEADEVWVSPELAASVTCSSNP